MLINVLENSALRKSNGYKQSYREDRTRQILGVVLGTSYRLLSDAYKGHVTFAAKSNYPIRAVYVYMYI